MADYTQTIEQMDDLKQQLQTQESKIRALETKGRVYDSIVANNAEADPEGDAKSAKTMQQMKIKMGTISQANKFTAMLNQQIF